MKTTEKIMIQGKIEEKENIAWHSMGEYIHKIYKLKLFDFMQHYKKLK